MSSPAQHAALGLFRPPLATPVLAEQAHELLGQQLEQALLPLDAYCTKQEAREDLSDWQADRVAEIRQALDALMRYDGQVEELLDRYRDGLAAAQEALAAQVPTLEAALQPNWQAIAERLSARLERYEPAPAPPPPLIDYLRRYLAQPHWQARLALPLDHRRAVANINSFTLNPPES